MLSLFTCLSLEITAKFQILSTNVNVLPITRTVYSSASDPALFNEVASLIGAESARTQTNRMKFAKSSGLKSFVFSSDPREPQIHVYYNRCTILNMNRESDGKIVLKRTVVTTECNVLSRPSKLVRTVINKWLPLKQEQLMQVYDTMNAASISKVSEVTQQVKAF